MPFLIHFHSSYFIYKRTSCLKCIFTPCKPHELCVCKTEQVIFTLCTHKQHNLCFSYILSMSADSRTVPPVTRPGERDHPPPPPLFPILHTHCNATLCWFYLLHVCTSGQSRETEPVGWKERQGSKFIMRNWPT